jgi:Protein of unknown function (DUF4031)
MTVYVDGERNAFGRMIMCHMWADTAAELHAMAAAIGMKRDWFQTPDAPKPASFPHYDVSLSRRARAVALGAVELERRSAALNRRAIRQRIIEDCAFAATWRYRAE